MQIIFSLLWLNIWLPLVCKTDLKIMASVMGTENKAEYVCNCIT